MSSFTLEMLGRFSRMRALAWHENVLYASQGYTLLSTEIGSSPIAWREVARYNPPWWRKLTCGTSLTFRLMRDGFHALAILPSGSLVAAVPGAIITLAPRERVFRVTHRILRGTRPLHICVVPDGGAYFGEYFDNSGREEVHIYASKDEGASWEVAYTFPKGAIRHVHNVIYDQWADCLWILTGDDGDECRILRANCDLTNVKTVLSGNQQARAVAAVPTSQGLYFSSDTPFETNHVYCLNRNGKLSAVAEISSSSIYGCRAEGVLFFSTMVEPSKVNAENSACLYGSADGSAWQRVLTWEKDPWPLGLFQYGNALLPDGDNATNVLAVSTVAVSPGDLQTSLWRVVR